MRSVTYSKKNPSLPLLRGGVAKNTRSGPVRGSEDKGLPLVHEPGLAEIWQAVSVDLEGGSAQVFASMESSIPVQTP